FVFRSHHHHIGDDAHIGDIEQTVVCGAVKAHKAGAIHGENHGEFLQCDIMHDTVISTLQEGGVNCHEGTNAFDGHACRAGDSVTFSNTNIDEAFGEFFRETNQPGSGGHGGSDGHDPL